ncbi:uncharacterized protein LOC116204656 [Punica granatum]|uniref:Uncharacterized protein LOC116204656 n=1 Tax=Punica granatum TaxID=22663 RepID=A0A6P8D7X4_PUNGR|nr:uncharacterized protein LOC116204656 [Punica granatum]
MEEEDGDGRGKETGRLVMVMVMERHEEGEGRGWQEVEVMWSAAVMEGRSCIDYEQFVVASFQESLSGPTLNWFMSIRAEDIPSWAELSKRFVEQHNYNMETPSSFLKLSTMEMAEGQKFEDYATNWRLEAAKHFPSICEAQQIQMFHETLKGAYYSYLMGHKSTFSEMIVARKQVDLGIKLGRIEGPTKGMGEESSRKTLAAVTSSGGRKGKEPCYQSSTITSLLPLRPRNTEPQLQPAQQVPPQQNQQGGVTQSQPRRQYAPLLAPLSHIYRQLLAGNKILPIAPGPNFDPTNQDQSKLCEYHQGAPWHTLDNCWRLWEEIQKMIGANKLPFNAIRPPNMQANPLPDHGSSSGPSISMISVCTLGEDESKEDDPSPFVIEYVPAEAAVRFTKLSASPTPFVLDVPTREPYSDSKIPWAYGGDVGSLEHQFSVMGVTCSGRVYKNLEAVNKGKVPAAAVGTVPEVTPIPPKKVTEEDAKAFMKIIKVSEYKVVEQMTKSPAHVSLLALLLISEPHREALLWVLTVAQVPKEMAPDMIEETVSSIFSNTILFSNDELPSEGWAHSRALHIVCKCNNYVIGRVMIDNGSALNVCSVTTLKQMNIDLNRIRLSKTAVRAFDGTRREVNEEIDLLIDVCPCSFSITFQVLNILNAFSLLLGRPWIQSAGAVPSSLHQRLKFIVEEKLITVKGEEDYAIYKEMNIPYIIVGDDEKFPFHSFETISVIRD